MSLFTDLLANNNIEKIYLIDIGGYNTDTSQAETLYFSSKKWITEPWESPANQVHDDCMSEDRLTLFSRGLFDSAFNETSYGEVVLNNIDGDLDRYMNHAFNGRPINVRLGGYGFTYADFGIVIAGTIDKAIFEYDVVRFQLRGNLYKLQVPMNTAKYAGTNSGSTGNEGLANDISGLPKVDCFGECKNVPVVTVNSSAFRMQFHAAGTTQAIDAAYDKGGTLDITTDYTNDLTNGIVDLVASPAGQVTADVKGDAVGGYVNTASDIAKRMITTRTAYTTSNLDTTSFSDLNTANSAAIGIYIPPRETQVIDNVSAVLGSIGATIFERRDGKLSVFRFNGVEGASIASFGESDIIENTFKAIPSDYENPIYQAKIGWGKNWTVQNRGELVTSSVLLPESRVSYLSQEYRYAAPAGALDASIKSIWLDANIYTRDSLIVNEVDANAEAVREFDLRSVPHREFELVVKTNAFALDLGKVITITHRRFGFEAGEDAIITYIQEDPRNNNAFLRIFK